MYVARKIYLNIFQVRNKGSVNGPANFKVGLFLNAADATPSSITKTETNGK